MIADRTIVALLWHENIIDILDKLPHEEKFRVYKQMLNNSCFGDFVDRITFKKQIWYFSEQSSLIKTLNNNFLLHSLPELTEINSKQNKAMRIY